MRFFRRRTSRQDKPRSQYTGGSPTAAEMMLSMPGEPEPLFTIGDFSKETGYPIISNEGAKQLALDALKFAGQNVVKDKPLISQVLRQRALDAVADMGPRTVAIGLQLAIDANHEYDVWVRVKNAAFEQEESTPEGIDPDLAHAKFINLLGRSAVRIGRESPAEMTKDGLIYKQHP